MCPLRIILIFLSASLAGFLAWKSFSSKDTLLHDNAQEKHNDEEAASHKSSLLKQACNKAVVGFWTLVDMANGQYLWRNLVNNNKGVKAN